MRKRLAALAVCLCLPAHGLMAAETSDAVTARISASTIVIANQAERPVCYAIHEARLLTRIEWGPECSERNRIPPQQSVRVPFAPDDYRPSGVAVVSWWFEGRHVVAGQLQLTLPGRSGQGNTPGPGGP